MKKRLLYCLAAVVSLAGGIYVFCPKPTLLDAYTYSRAVYDREGRLLNLSLSEDDKYRLFVPYEKIGDYSKKMLVLYEDKRFFSHCGIDFLSLGRAISVMLLGGRKQGASTISMQVARLRFMIDTSHILGKIEQMFRALQLERHYSKQEILEAYFNLCPLGGNIEGVGAAALIYFNTDAEKLNLPQSAALTVIPQNPEKRAPLRNNGQAEIKRAVLRLKKLWINEYGHKQAGNFDVFPEFLRNLPKLAMHTVRRLKKQHLENELYTTIDLNWQKLLEKTLRDYVKSKEKDGIKNAAALIVNTKNYEVLAEVGSADFFNAQIFGQTDGLTALRSPGSALKPFIYALALDEGIIHPLSLLKDVPENYGLYTPENYDHTFKGLINATDALVQSRNVPAVTLLQQLSPNRFYNFLKDSGTPRLNSASYYGLALALGGAETSLIKLAELYMMLANLGEFHNLSYLLETKPTTTPRQLLSKESAFLTLEMLKTNPEPKQTSLPFLVKNRRFEVAFKTGTSFGHKDAISVGIAGNYVVGVWIGNFDGAPNNALVGRDMATPLMFRLFYELDAEGMIKKQTYPLDEMKLFLTDICLDTGEFATPECEHKGKTFFISGVTKAPYLNITRKIPIDIQTGKRACRHTPPSTELKAYQFWSSDVLNIYEKAGIELKRPPEFLHDCQKIGNLFEGRKPIIKYPANGSIFFKHKTADRLSLSASLDADAVNVFWYVNDRFIGKSKSDEAFECDLPVGKAVIKAVDDRGRSSVSVIEGRLLPLVDE